MNLDDIDQALGQLKKAFADKGITLKKVLVDKTMPVKYEMYTGKKWGEEPRVACDPFTVLRIRDVGVVGEDNERFRNHKEWPEEES